MMQGFGYAVGPALGAGLFEVSLTTLMAAHVFITKQELSRNVKP